PADDLHRLRATALSTSFGGVHPPRLPRLLPGGALMGQAPRRGATACAGTGAAQGVGLCRLRHRPRLCAHRPPLGGRWPGGVGLGGGHRRALGALVLLLAPPAGHAGERDRAVSIVFPGLARLQRRALPPSTLRGSGVWTTS